MIINESRKLNEVSVHNLSNGSMVYQNTDKRGKTHYYYKKNRNDDRQEISKDRFDKMVKTSQGTTEEDKDFHSTEAEKDKEVVKAYTEDRLKELKPDQLDRLEKVLAKHDEKLKKKHEESQQEWIDRIKDWISNTSNWINSNIISNVFYR